MIVGPSQLLKPTTNVLPHTLHTLWNCRLVGVSIITYEERIPILEFVFSYCLKGIKEFPVKVIEVTVQFSLIIVVSFVQQSGQIVE